MLGGRSISELFVFFEYSISEEMMLELVLGISAYMVGILIADAYLAHKKMRNIARMKWDRP